MSLKSSCSSLSNETRVPHENDNDDEDDEDSLHRSFNQLLGSLDLPADKIEEMNSYDNRKKWEILCSRSLMKVHQSPGAYLERLRSHIRLRVSPPTETLRGLEVSLRTYSIDWLHEFLNERHSLDVLASIVDPNGGTKLNLSSENFQIALRCLRALLSDSAKGCAMAINHPLLFEGLVANLCSAASSMRNRTLILQLLALACQKSEDGQQRVLRALKAANAHRQLMNFLTAKCTDQMSIVATLSLIRALLSATDDMNYRVYLQYDFHRIGLDSRIERLLLNESSLIPQVIDEISAYKSVVINVNQLARDRDSGEKLRAAEARICALERKLMDYEESGQEAGKERWKDGPAEEMSEECKVDKTTEVDSRAEISQKSTAVNVAPSPSLPLMKGDAEASGAGKGIVTGPAPPPPPPPPPPSRTKAFMAIRQRFTTTPKKLPSLHWSPLRPNQIRGTVFSDINDARLHKIINFTHFEDKFCLADMSTASCALTPQINCTRMPKYVTLLEAGRLRNVSILRRKLNFDADAVVRLINDYDFNQLNRSSGGSSIRLLTGLAPRDDEMAAYRQYMAQRKDTVVLSEEDKFLLKLSLVERLPMKLNVMEFMANFGDRMSAVTSQLAAISCASLSLESSPKFKAILEIILTFGNYMNGHKSSGSAYGFRLCGTLEKLAEMRSNDKRETLLGHIVSDVVAQHFPALLSLATELSCVAAASRVSMKSVATEVALIESGWREMSDECDLSSDARVVRAFRDTAQCECNKLTNEFEQARNNYRKCLAYFGESDVAIDSNEFFGAVERFVGDFKASVDKVKPAVRAERGEE